jgi:hypothetical protein
MHKNITDKNCNDNEMKHAHFLHGDMVVFGMKHKPMSDPTLYLSVSDQSPHPC